MNHFRLHFTFHTYLLFGIDNILLGQTGNNEQNGCHVEERNVIVLCLENK